MDLSYYGQLYQRNDMPPSLQDKNRQQLLLTSFEAISELHEQLVLPLILRNQNYLKQLFLECMQLIGSTQPRLHNREYFEKLQIELDDKLGINSFYVQPMQHLTRYPLIQQQFVLEFREHDWPDLLILAAQLILAVQAT